MDQPSVIETGVDKLVALVKQNKRISVPDAAKILNVSRVVIEEWANFLEEEGIISIEYKFTTPYLVERQLTKKDIEDKVKEFKGKKDGFVRKAEVTLSLLEKRGEAFDDIKASFKKLKEEMGSDLKKVEQELKLLQEYNSEKRGIDEEINKQELVFKQRIKDMESQISKEKQRYTNILTDIKHDESALNKEQVNAGSMRAMLKEMNSGVKQMQESMESIKEKLSRQNEMIDSVESHISRLKSIADSQKKVMEAKSSEMKGLVAESVDQEKKIMSLQDDILKKCALKKKLLSDEVAGGKSCAENFKKFFESNKKIDEYLNKINEDKIHLEKELKELIVKAKAFNLMTKSQDVKNYVNDLQKKFKQVEADKDSFEREIGNLHNMIKV